MTLGTTLTYMQCKLGGACPPLQDPSLVDRVTRYLGSAPLGPATLLAFLTVAVSAALLYLRPDPRHVFQKVKSALRMRPEQAVEQQAEQPQQEQQTQQPAGDPPARVPLGVRVFPPEVYLSAGIPAN